MSVNCTHNYMYVEHNSHISIFHNSVFPFSEAREKDVEVLKLQEKVTTYIKGVRMCL